MFYSSFSGMDNSGSLVPVRPVDLEYFAIKIDLTQNLTNPIGNEYNSV
jgi:hypothetical protein